MTRSAIVAWTPSRRAAARLAAVFALVAGGCGSGGHHATSVAGLYAVDVAATFSLPSAPAPGEASVVASVRARFDPAAHSLLLRADQTFRMETATGAGSLVVEGTWSSGAGVVQLTVTTVDGAPPTAEEGTPDVLRVEGGTLVLDGAGGRRIVWRRAA